MGIIITKEQFDQILNDRTGIDIEEFFHFIEDQYNCSILVRKKEDISAGQKRRMTKAIFGNDEVMEQLRKAKEDREAGISTYSDDEEEFAKLVKEVNNEG